jgi:hypothetical protein
VIRIFIIFEAHVDFTIASELADRVLVEQIDWLENDHLDAQREWVGEMEGTQLAWRSIADQAKKLGIRVHGYFNGEPGQPDASAARRAIAYLLRLRELNHIEQIDAIVLIRDADHQPQRRQGLEQARSACLIPGQIIIGLADPEREAWVISGFDPADENENQQLVIERRILGFDPRDNSQQLTAGSDNQANRSPKRVLQALTNDNPDRERQCWQSTALDTLRQRGRGNGLAAYLNEIKARLVPRITGRT